MKFLLIYLFIAVADILTTIRAINIGAREVNSLVASKTGGVSWPIAIWFKAIICALILVDHRAAVAVMLITLYAVASNLISIKLCERLREHLARNARDTAHEATWE